jgi:hypothetical protein
MPSIDGNLSHEIMIGTKNGKVLCLSGGQLAIPVELTSFSGYTADGNVYLQWSTATEKNNYGFEIERVAETSDSKENILWRSIGFINGSGTTSQLKSYSFADRNIGSGKYIYRLKQIDYDGSFAYSNEVEVNIDAPVTYILEQNFPNPFNPVTIIRFSIPEETNVKLSIYNLLAEEIAVLINEPMTSGFHQVEWRGTDNDNKILPTGAYFYKLESRILPQGTRTIKSSPERPVLSPPIPCLPFWAL